jgi:hypothetical protein
MCFITTLLIVKTIEIIPADYSYRGKYFPRGNCNAGSLLLEEKFCGLLLLQPKFTLLRQLRAAIK